jgi:hypothetical protein
MDSQPPRRNRDEVRVVIDLTNELTAWLRSTDARTLMKEIVAEAVKSEIRIALEDELVDVEGAAAVLDMTEGALRKAGTRTDSMPARRQSAALSPDGSPQQPWRHIYRRAATNSPLVAQSCRRGGHS